ncbi:MAG: NAD-dependent epimerase/dehydratase family protein [Cyanobacteria bacterium P01_D01_bin.105]
MELLRDPFDTSISVGTVHNRPQKTADKAAEINKLADFEPDLILGVTTLSLAFGYRILTVNFRSDPNFALCYALVHLVRETHRFTFMPYSKSNRFQQHCFSQGETSDHTPEKISILITGASGGIGQHLRNYLLCKEIVSQVIVVSRQSQEDTFSIVCDLTETVPQLTDVQLTDAVGSSNSSKISLEKVDWIIHLATSYQLEPDLGMLNNMLKFAQQNNVTHFIYVSSWVVHFPRGLLRNNYIETKRACEELLFSQEEIPECIENVYIVRPSVVLGKGLLWSKVLTKLASVHPVIPKAFTRSFITIEQLNQEIASLILQGERLESKEPKGKSKDRASVTAITLLGERDTLASKASEQAHSEFLPLLGATAESLRWILWLAPPLFLVLLPQSSNGLLKDREAYYLIFLYGLILLTVRALPSLLARASDYLSGFVNTCFEPQSEVDILSLVDYRNSNIHIRGYNNSQLYFHTPNSCKHTTILLKQFNKAIHLNFNEMSVRVQAGMTFAQLLPYLKKHNFGLENYPNYHYVSIGSCVLLPVHGSSINYPFIADLVSWIRYYDRERNEVIEVASNEKEFKQIALNQEKINKIVILAVELKICREIRYRLNSRTEILSELYPDKILAFFQHQNHCEIRINSPYSRKAYLQSYEQTSSDQSNANLLEIKADFIGSQWNTLQSNQLLSWLSQKTAVQFINFEWFFQHDDFMRFWEEIINNRKKYHFYKLLIRYNRNHSSLSTPYHGTISVDIAMIKSRPGIELVKDLFQTYRPLEHYGKYSILKQHF